jgi:exonuclease VII large subunit
MGGRARVKSIDALQAMTAVLERFRGEAGAALDDLAMEVRRALEWIHHDCKEYWVQEVRRGWERVAEARVRLQQAMTIRRIAEHQPSCIDEKKALEQAKRRLQLAQEKVAAVQHWAHAVDRIVKDYQASRSQLTNWLDADYPQALAALRHMMEALEMYVAMEAPADPHRPIEPGTTEEQHPPCEPGT